jgi:ribosomal protein S18 acetylase RimI-like enzyme
MVKRQIRHQLALERDMVGRTHDHMFSENYDIKRDIIRNKDYYRLILDKKTEKIVGYIWYDIRKYSQPVLYIHDIFIDAKYRGKGYGRTSMKTIMEDRKDDYKMVELRVAGNNPGAERLYKSLGFKIISHGMAYIP